MTFIAVQHGVWEGVEADILLESTTASAFLTAAHDYCKATGRPMPEIAEPCGGLRTIAQTTEMQWAFDYGPHGKNRAGATAAQKARSAALYAKYNMSTVSVARPSINGTHTTGFYFDVATLAFQSWLLAGNAARYGLTRPLGTADPNHWKYTPGTATAALTVTGLDSATIAPTIYGDTMLSMNRTKDNTIAFFDGEGHWQEFKYTSDNAPTAAIKQYQLDFVNGLAHSIPSVPYDDLGWDLRSNKLPALKRPLFADNGTSIIPIAQTDGTGANTADQVAAAVDAILKDDFAALAKQEGTDQAAVLAAIGQVDENTLATFGLQRLTK